MAKRSFNDLKYQNANNKSKTVWQLIRNETNSNHPEPYPQLLNDKNGNQSLDLSSAAQELNNFFIDSTDNLIQLLGSAIPPMVENSVNSSIFLSPINISENKEIISQVRVKKFAGYDGIPCSVLIYVVDLTAPVLTELINCSFCQGIFPEHQTNRYCKSNS